MNKPLWTLVIVISIVLIYQFILHPLQMDRALDTCLQGDKITYGQTIEDSRKYDNFCFQRYGRIK